MLKVEYKKDIYRSRIILLIYSLLILFSYPLSKRRIDFNIGVMSRLVNSSYEIGVSFAYSNKATRLVRLRGRSDSG